MVNLVRTKELDVICLPSIRTWQVAYVPEGLEAVVFTADGDMRQALNNLQATFSGFQFVNQDNVFKVWTWFMFYAIFRCNVVHTV